MADLQKYADDFLTEMIDEAVLGACFEVHRASKLGTLFLDEVDATEEEKYKIVDEIGYDVFGQPKSGSKKNIECECPNCKRTLAASRFAPHLEKCMGMGRNSSRIASQRIANSGKLAAGLGESLCNDDDPEFASDADWFSSRDEGPSSSRKTSKKRKVDKNIASPRSRGPILKTRGPSSSPRSNSGGSKGGSQQLDHSDHIHIDVVGASGVSSISDGGVEDSPIHHRNKSPFDPSLGTWEPHVSSGTDLQSENMIAPPSGLPKKKTKSSKHGTTKKSKKRHAINYTFS